MADASRRATIFWAFAAIYIIWGSTYLGIQIAVRELPPLILAGGRFTVAGVVIFLWARSQGEAMPAASVWGTGALLGTLFFVLGNGLVVWAEQRVPSGKTALLASTSPLWTVMLDSALAGWRRPPWRVLVGVILGFTGLLLLAAPNAASGEARVPLIGVAALLVASIAWSVGSVYSHVRRLPGSPAMVTAVKMLGGGAQLLVLSLLAGQWRDFHAASVSWRVWAAFVYLIVFGSIIGFTAFTYLLRVSTPQKVATSSYVNPLVAVLLGWAFAGESITSRTILAGAVILGGVLLIRLPGRSTTPDESTDVGSLDTGEFPAPAIPRDR
ncbi:MAG: EamA family transporter [Gemmatimonadota bacterium]